MFWLRGGGVLEHVVSPLASWLTAGTHPRDGYQRVHFMRASTIGRALDHGGDRGSAPTTANRGAPSSSTDGERDGARGALRRHDHMLFRDNQPGCAIILEAEFRNMLQGDLPVAEYNRRLKALADMLGEVGAPVSVHALTL